jgi:hypothetical protein
MIQGGWWSELHLQLESSLLLLLQDIPIQTSFFTLLMASNWQQGNPGADNLLVLGVEKHHLMNVLGNTFFTVQSEALPHHDQHC